MSKAAKFFESAIPVAPFNHEFTNGPVSSAASSWPSDDPNAAQRVERLDSLSFDCFQFK
jgi:hypothetical protein